MLVIAWSISASVGRGFLASSAAAASTCPDWQNPHCGTSSVIQARCTGWLPSRESPSIVVIERRLTADTGVVHVRVASPSSRTVQEPHCGRNVHGVGPAVDGERVWRHRLAPRSWLQPKLGCVPSVAKGPIGWVTSSGLKLATWSHFAVCATSQLPLELVAGAASLVARRQGGVMDP